jgi:beta-glucosidase
MIGIKMLRSAFITSILVISLIWSTFSQVQTVPAYKNTNLDFEERVEDLVSRMTLDQKISQMVYNAPAIESLGIPEYNWWNEALHGVARAGKATVFPQAIGLAATWDCDLMFRVATCISDEARAKYNDFQVKGKRGIYQGLTFWSPNINIFRDPRWGRGMETYGEDPYLTGTLAVQFVKGMQGNDPKYLKTVATSKHFAVHSGPEAARHEFDARVDETDLRQTYLPAFRMTVEDAGVQSVMCAYNRFMGDPCCGSNALLNKILREEWGFKGYVVSDCWAIMDFYNTHKVVATPEEAAAMALKAGTDLNCGVTYPHLSDAVKQGLVTEDEINISVKRLFLARFRLGMFDPPDKNPWSKIPLSILDSDYHKSLALETARKSIVLLKNDNRLLPLRKDLKTVAVIGPNADNVAVLLGNYNGTPVNPITPLEGIRKKLPGTQVLYALGCPHAKDLPVFETIPAGDLYTDASLRNPGLKAEFFNNKDLKGKPVHTQVDAVVDYNWWDKAPFADLDPDNFSVRWTGVIVPQKSGTYAIGAEGVNGFQLYFEDSLIARFNSVHETWERYEMFELEGGKAYKIRLDYFEYHMDATIRLIWSFMDATYEKEAMDIVDKADLVILCMGLSPRLEGEEMEVNIEGFSGGDRVTIGLPAIQQNLIRRIHEAKKPYVLVLLNGSALSVEWEQENIPAILEAWYPGQAAGQAIADVLFGDYNPAGRLPVTFYRSTEQLPPFEDYSMKDRTYRYFKGDPLYPFGFGLSYTTFRYEDLAIRPADIKTGDTIYAEARVTNAGLVPGEEVVQVYLTDLESKSRIPSYSLKGYERILLAPGESRIVHFKISPDMMSVVTETGEQLIEPGMFRISIGGSSPGKRSLDLGAAKNVEGFFSVSGR